jgi:hypothetical protein
VNRFFPLDIHFEMSVDEKRRSFVLIIPVTGIKHTLYFQMLNRWNFPLEQTRNRNFYIMQSMYEIEPALPQGDTLQFEAVSNIQRHRRYQMINTALPLLHPLVSLAEQMDLLNFYFIKGRRKNCTLWSARAATTQLLFCSKFSKGRNLTFYP